MHANTPKMTRNELDFVSTVYGSVMMPCFNVGMKPSQFGQVFRPNSQNYQFACERDKNLYQCVALSILDRFIKLEWLSVPARLSTGL